MKPVTAGEKLYLWSSHDLVDTATWSRSTPDSPDKGASFAEYP